MNLFYKSIKLLPVFFCLFFTGLFAATTAIAETADFIPATFSAIHSGILSNVLNSPPTFSLLPKTTGARSGNIWIKESSQGLLVLGKVLGEPPQWPRSAATMNTGDHIEIWLAADAPVQMPPIGWINQSGSIILKNAADCNLYKTYNNDARIVFPSCAEWYKQQVHYRKNLVKLFVRQWQIAPGIVRETYATPMYAFLNNLSYNSGDNLWENKNNLTPLQPKGKPRVFIRKSHDAQSSYIFAVLIPWEAFPPMSNLRLENFKILVDIFSPGKAKKYGAFSTTSPARTYGDIQSYNKIRLEKPRDYFITPCHYPLKDMVSIFTQNHISVYDPTEMPNADTSSYFLPTHDTDVRKAIMITNYAAVYQDNPFAYSPVANPAEFFTQQIDKNSTICGPRLAAAFNSNHQIIYSSYKITQSFIAKKQKNNDIIIKEGPYRGLYFFTSGTCGGCPHNVLNIYFISHEPKTIEHIFSCINADATEEKTKITVSPDWKKIIIQKTLAPYSENKNKKLENIYNFDAKSNSYDLGNLIPHDSSKICSESS